MGNDFLPHIPALDIYNHAIDTLLDNYVDTVIMNGKYIIENKQINSDVFYDFLVRLAGEEEQTIIESFGKKKKRYHCQSTDPFDIEMHKIDNLMFKIEDPIMLGCGSIVEWKERFYDHYYTVTSDEIIEFSQKMVDSYMMGLKWVTLYYFDKCPAWDYFYPFDHAPFLTDMVIKKCNFDKIIFNENKPLSPFEQLLIVLPKESNYLLPLELRRIMTNPNSSIAHLYPDKFELDMIGKKKYWMCNPILPNLEINLIKKIFEKYYIKLSDEAKNINKITSNIIFN
jgi:5'-3' exonuclease